jgi:hypothetical protein
MPGPRGARFLWTATIGFFLYLLFCLACRATGGSWVLGSAIMAQSRCHCPVHTRKTQGGIHRSLIFAGLVVLYLIGRLTARASAVE